MHSHLKQRRVISIYALCLLCMGLLIPSVAVRADSDAGKTSDYGNFLSGLYATSLNDTVSAARFMLRVVEDNPGDQRLLRRAFLLSLEAGMMEPARELAQKITDGGGKMSIATMFLAVDAVKSDLAKAQVLFDSVPKSGLAVYAVPLARAWIYVGQKNYDKAIETLAPLNEQSGFLTLRNLHAGLIYDLAGRPKDAEESFRKTADDFTKAPVRVVRALGMLLERNGRANEAIDMYKAFLNVSPDNLVVAAELARAEKKVKPGYIVANAVEGVAEGLFHIASVLPQQSVGTRAVIYAQIAHHLRPDFPPNQLLLGDLLESQGRLAEANAMYGSVRPDSPYGWTAQLRITANLQDLGKEKEAEEMLRRLAQQKPEQMDAAFRLANLLRIQERYDEAVGAYDEAYKRIGDIQPRHWVFFHYRGIALERAKIWERAEKDFKKALELKPDDPFVLNYLGYSWIERGENLEEAQKMIERAVKLRRNDGYIVDSLGWVLYRVGKYAEAVTQLERAVRLRPQDPVINDHLGDAYWRAGRRLEAQFQWRRALGLNPEKKEMTIIEQKLENGLGKAKPIGSGG